MFVVAIDPGGKSGIAASTDKMDYLTACVNTPEEVWTFIAPNVHHVIYEEFGAETISKYGLHTVRIIGGILALCWKYNIPVTKHMPQKRLAFKTQAREILQHKRYTLKQTYMVHELDALAHLLAWEHDNG